MRTKSEKTNEAPNKRSAGELADECAELDESLKRNETRQVFSNSSEKHKP
jgi:hypothetical protein